MDNDSDLGIGPAARARQLMRTGQTDALFRWLSATGIAALPPMLRGLEEAQKKYHSGLLEPEAWVEAQVLAFQAVLQLPGFGAAPTLPPALGRTRLEHLVFQHELEKALDACAPLGDAVLLLHARFSLLKGERAAGRLETVDWELAVSKIEYALMALAERLPDPPPPTANPWQRLLRWLR